MKEKKDKDTSNQINEEIIQKVEDSLLNNPLRGVGNSKVVKRVKNIAKVVNNNEKKPRVKPLASCFASSSSKKQGLTLGFTWLQ